MEGGRKSRQRNALRPRTAPRRSSSRALWRTLRHHASVRADRDQTAIEDAFDITSITPRPRFVWKRGVPNERSWLVGAERPPRPLPHQLPGLRQRAALPAARHQGQLPQARPRPAGPALVGGARVPTQGSQEVWLQEDQSAWGTLTVAPNPADPATLVTRQVKTERCDYRGFYANVRDAILGADPLAVTPEDGFRVIRLLELARESSAQARTLKVEF